MPSETLTRRERVLIATFAFLFLTALVAPALPANAMEILPFADVRPWHGLPHAMDVLSNLPFAVFGAWGLLWLHRFDRLHESVDAESLVPLAEPPGNTLDCAWLFFTGLIVTAVGSAFYHLQPDALRLSADRAGMTVAFAGLVGIAVCDRVSQRAGWAAAWCVLGGGLLAVAVSHETGNVLPWGLVQFGGMALVLALSLVRPVDGAIGVRLGWVIALYALAKGAELADLALYEATGRFISGHSLKHLVAAMAALPVMAALRAMGRQTLRHNLDAAAATA